MHLNPVYIEAHADKPTPERVAALRSYTWSSYRSYVGLSKRLDYVTYEPVLTMMGKLRKKQASVYQRFVESGIADIDAAFVDAKGRSPYCIGSHDYLEEVAAQHERLAGSEDHPKDLSFQHAACRYSPDEVQQAVAEVFGVERVALLKRRHNSWLRPLCSRALQVYCGLTQREIGQVLSIGTGAAVSKQLRLLDEAFSQDKPLKASWCAIERKLERAK